jgi:hypothetical protein
MSTAVRMSLLPQYRPAEPHKENTSLKLFQHQSPFILYTIAILYEKEEAGFYQERNIIKRNLQ